MGRAIITVSTRDFNPRPREGGDYDKTLIRLYAGISIHAPARGATEQAGIFGIMFDISIHAPARGATCRQAAVRYA